MVIILSSILSSAAIGLCWDIFIILPLDLLKSCYVWNNYFKDRWKKKQDRLCTRVFLSPKYIHYRNISLKSDKDPSQHSELLFFYSICQKFCSWHNSLILFNLCSLMPAMNLIISMLDFKHMVSFSFWATHLGTQQPFPWLSLETHMDAVMESPFPW